MRIFLWFVATSIYKKNIIHSLCKLNSERQIIFRLGIKKKIANIAKKKRKRKKSNLKCISTLQNELFFL